METLRHWGTIFISLFGIPIGCCLAILILFLLFRLFPLIIRAIKAAYSFIISFLIWTIKSEQVLHKLSSHRLKSLLRSKACEKIGHEWSGCMCTRCKSTRDEGHIFIKQVCHSCHGDYKWDESSTHSHYVGARKKRKIYPTYCISCYEGDNLRCEVCGKISI